MDHSGFDISCVKDALSRKLAPLQKELARLCKSTEERALKSPEAAADVVRNFLNEKKKYLQTFNFLLGLGDASRDGAHDLVADTARTCLVAYLNKTENWEAGLQLFDECLALANSNSLRSRLRRRLRTTHPQCRWPACCKTHTIYCGSASTKRHAASAIPGPNTYSSSGNWSHTCWQESLVRASCAHRPVHHNCNRVE